MFRDHAAPRTLAALMGLTLLSAGGCLFPDLGDSRNLSPVIVGFKVDDERVNEALVRGEAQRLITALFYDPNGDDLSGDAVAWECSDGTVIGDGASIRYQPPEGIVWQVPPQELSATCTVCVTDRRSDPVCRDLLLHLAPPCPDENEPPEIRSVTVSPESILIDERTTITVDAVDPEGDALTYRWKPAIGRIEGEGPQVDWVASDTCCPDTYSIELTVWDGCKGSTTFIEIWVDI